MKFSVTSRAAQGFLNPWPRASEPCTQGNQTPWITEPIWQPQLCPLYTLSLCWAFKKQFKITPALTSHIPPSRGSLLFISPTDSCPFYCHSCLLLLPGKMKCFWKDSVFLWRDLLALSKAAPEMFSAAAMPSPAPSLILAMGNSRAQGAHPAENWLLGDFSLEQLPGLVAGRQERAGWRTQRLQGWHPCRCLCKKIPTVSCKSTGMIQELCTKQQSHSCTAQSLPRGVTWILGYLMP